MATAAKLSNTQTCFNKVIAFAGCFALTRADVHAIVLEDTSSNRAADLYAFGPQTRTIALPPISIAQFRAETA